MVVSQGERLVGAISSMKARAPVTGGNFGVWGGMFSTFDCAVKGYRQKEDAWNAIISGFMTGGCLAARSEFAPTRLESVVSLSIQVDPNLPSVPRSLAVFYSVYSKELVFSFLAYSAKDSAHKWHLVSIRRPLLLRLLTL